MENLVKIQNELKVPKTNINAFGKYKYRTAEDILEAVKPILLRYTATLTLSDEIILVGSKVFLKATAKLNDTICYGYAELAEHKGMSAEQATGTASSYARKYALNGLFLIDETESDADSQKPSEKLPLTINDKIENAKAILIVANAQNLGSLWKTVSAEMQVNTEVLAHLKELQTKLGLNKK